MNLSHIWAEHKGSMIGIGSGTFLVVWLLTWGIWGQYQLQALVATGIVEEVIATAMPEDSFDLTRRYIDDRFRNLISLMESERVLSLLSYRLILHDINMPDPFRPLSPIEELYGKSAIEGSRSYFKALLDSAAVPESGSLDVAYRQLMEDFGYAPAQLQEHLEMERVPGTEFIRIRFSSGEGRLSAFSVNVLSQEFIRYYQLMEVAKSKTSVSQLEKLAARKRKKLDEKMQQLRTYKNKRKGKDVHSTNIHLVKVTPVKNDPALEALVADVSLALEEYLQVLNKLNSVTFVSINPKSQIKQVEYGTPAAYPKLFPSFLFALIAAILGFFVTFLYWWIREAA